MEDKKEIAEKNLSIQRLEATIAGLRKELGEHVNGGRTSGGGSKDGASEVIRQVNNDEVDRLTEDLKFQRARAAREAAA